MVAQDCNLSTPESRSTEQEDQVFKASMDNIGRLFQTKKKTIKQLTQSNEDQR
jgi:hypothetical protein